MQPPSNVQTRDTMENAQLFLGILLKRNSFERISSLVARVPFDATKLCLYLKYDTVRVYEG